MLNDNRRSLQLLFTKYFTRKHFRSNPKTKRVVFTQTENCESLTKDPWELWNYHIDHF